MTYRPTPTRRAPRGFTLIEMMLAIGVMALILAMLASSFSTIAHSKVNAEGPLIFDREARALLWKLTKELRNPAPPPNSTSTDAPFGHWTILSSVDVRSP